MNKPASSEELNQTVSTINKFVETHEHRTFCSRTGILLVNLSSLEKPRIIGNNNAKFIRLVKGIGTELLAGVTYSAIEMDPNPDIINDRPIRQIAINADGPTGVNYEGLAEVIRYGNINLDRGDYPITSNVLIELISDIKTAKSVNHQT